MGNEAIASDLTQDIFIKVWEHLDTFRNESKISTWIYRISVNSCLLYLRKKSTKNELSISEFPAVAVESYSEEEEEKLAKMYSCIHLLDENGRMIILMVLEGLPYEEIAEVVGVSEDTLRVKIHRIKKNLTQCVQNGRL